MSRLRSIAFTVSIALTAVLLTIVFAPVMVMGERKARSIIALWSRIALWEMKVLAGVDYRIEGEEFIPATGSLVVSNHQSLWETIALYSLLPNPVFILKRELLAIPVYGWWARIAGNIPIDRKGGARSLRAMRKRAADAILAGAQVVVFPEGTRVAPGETSKFQPGVAGIYRAVDAECALASHDSGRHWAKLGGSLSPGTITIRFLPPLPVGLERRAFLHEAKRRIDAARPDLTERPPEPDNLASEAPAHG